MAYRITATTPADAELLQHIRDIAYARRTTVSEVLRDAFQTQLDLEDIDNSRAPGTFAKPHRQKAN